MIRMFGGLGAAYEPAAATTKFVNSVATFSISKCVFQLLEQHLLLEQPPLLERPLLLSVSTREPEQLQLIRGLRGRERA